MPPSWDWQFARLDEPGQATVGHYQQVSLLLADPPLVLHVEVEMNLARLGIDPAFAAPFGLLLTGEIDALIGDPIRSRLWICEVKDVSIGNARAGL